MKFPNPLQERRKQQRIRVLGHLEVYLEGEGTPVTLRDIGLGGFSTETAFPFASDAVHAFAFTVAPGWSTVLRAKVVHSRPEQGDPSPTYVTGFEFVTAPGRDLAVAELVERIASRAPR